MELILNQKGSAVKPLLFVLLLVVAFWFLRTAFGQISAGGMILSMTTLETVEQILEQVKEENSEISNRGSGKKKPSIKEEIEHAKGRISKNEYKAAKSNYKRMVEHVDKLEKYKQNPIKYDNLGLLKNAPSEQVKQKIIESRIAHLEKEIQAFYNNIIKIIN
jgi:hypothetical protein